ncbi:Protein kinase-like domain [Pseudocohnilembus persalinus]|uniref:Protein kinase-like domain n=1 Tax=Pseudocohnilembus persalinus TaxID=266149 RepID=A0A0V0QXD8_PSEPJ|nr:Protein kinase-like domain [Pseudocohnilembus persalinus]|eukprot:KRX07059.1 Protein kinase-like domain [Pseudocohnilembus persalinus]
MTQDDKQEKQIKFQLGLCTLEAFTRQRAIQNIYWSLNEIKYIFHRLLSFVVFMADNGWYHGDIKPQNIVLCSREGQGAKDNQFILKMIDFGGAMNQFKIQRQRTPVFFNSFLRVKGKTEEQQRKMLRKYEDIFESQEERFVTETYTILRTLQYLFVLSEIAQDGDELNDVNNLFLLDLEENLGTSSTFYWNYRKRYQTEERILKLFDIMLNQMHIKSEEQPAFVEFIKLLKSEFLYGKYKNCSQIRELLQNQKVFPQDFQQKAFIQDDNNIVKTSIRQVLNCQPQIGVKKYNTDPFELLFLMDSYIPNRKVLSGQKNWDLNQFFEDFLKNEKQIFFFLNGEEGMGKTSFLRYFKTNYLEKRKKNKNFDPILDITLDKSLCQNQTDYTNRVATLVEIKLKELKTGQKLIVILDECDNLRLVPKQQTILQMKMQESLDEEQEEVKIDQQQQKGNNLTDQEQEQLDQISQKVQYTDILAPFRQFGLEKFKIVVASKFQDLKNFSSFIQDKQKARIGETYLQCVLQGFDQIQVEQYIQKYTNLMKRRKNYLVEEAAFFEDKQTYSRIIKENKLTDVCKNPLILRIALQVLPQLEQGILDSMLINAQSNAGILQKIKNRASLIKKGIQSKQILFKTFLKQLIIKKVAQLSVKEQFKIIGKVKQPNSHYNSQALVDLCVELIIEVNKKIAQLSFMFSRLPVSFQSLAKNKQILKMMQNPKYSEIFPGFKQIDAKYQLLMILECSPLQENGTGKKPNSQQNEQELQTTRYEFQYRFLLETLVAEQYIKEMQYLKDSISKDNAINISKGLIKKENYSQIFSNDSFVKMKSMLIRNKELNKEEDKGVLDLVKSQSQTYFSKYWKNIYNWNIMKTTEAKMFGNTSNIVAANSQLLNDDGEEIQSENIQQQQQYSSSQQPLQKTAKSLFNNKMLKGVMNTVSGAASTFPKINFNYDLSQITNLFNQDESSKNQVYNGEYE